VTDCLEQSEQSHLHRETETGSTVRIVRLQFPKASMLSASIIKNEMRLPCVIAHLDYTLGSTLGRIEVEQRDGFFAFQLLSCAWSRRTRGTTMNLGQSHTHSHESARAATHLHGGWLLFVRMAWVVMLACAVGRFIASIPFAADIHPRQQNLLLCTADSSRDTRPRRPELWHLAGATPQCALSD
jgi:hypothetical protein